MPAKRKPATAPLATKKKEKKTAANPLFDKTPKNFVIGGDVQPRRDLTRYVKWPRCVRLQRQKRILMTRLKVPPSLNQFSQTCDKQQATQLFRLLNKYKKEDKAQKKERLTAQAEKGGETTAKKPHFVKNGLNHVTKL